MTPRLADTPVLATERLTLRALDPKDAEAFTAFYATDRAQFVGGPLNDKQAWSFFGTEIGHWTLRGFGMFTVTRKGDNTPLGIVGHWYPHGWPEKEIGWVLFDEDSEGQGIAFEAAKVCVDHAWDALGWDQIVSYIDRANTASVNLAKRLGATLDPNAAIPNPEKAVDVYRHPKPRAAA
ncbi:GNAT family N-acetyltransferase [Rhodobacteraceae bacterium]|nr:GNAT family N-acetyltransferase [Paracoccaceae bacterium]